MITQRCCWTRKGMHADTVFGYFVGTTLYEPRPEPDHASSPNRAPTPSIGTMAIVCMSQGGISMVPIEDVVLETASNTKVFAEQWEG